MSKRARAKRLTLRRDLAERMHADRGLSEDIDRIMAAIKRSLEGQELARAEVERREGESWAR